MGQLYSADREAIDRPLATLTSEKSWQTYFVWQGIKDVGCKGGQIIWNITRIFDKNISKGKERWAGSLDYNKNLDGKDMDET